MLRCSQAHKDQRVVYTEPRRHGNHIEYGTVIKPDAFDDGKQVLILFDDGTTDPINTSFLHPMYSATDA